MKKSIFLIILTSLFLFSLTAYAAEEVKSHDTRMPDSQQSGNIIRETDIEGYRFSYHLIDLQAHMKNMEGMQHTMQKTGTHHLMLYIQDAGGKTIDSAQVGYLIIGPDGSEQKVMTMQMSGAYGADINLSKPGEYTIKCKAVVGEKKLFDEFKHKID
jgi:hypothetical protein